MKLKDHVLLSVFNYPSLYLCATYEESRLLVLHHLFLINGNGVEWATTKDPSKGGYLVHPEYYKYRGEWTRKIDKPYGREKFEMEWEDLLGYGITEHLDLSKYEEMNERAGGLTEMLIKIHNEANQKELESGDWLRNTNRKPYDFYDKGWPFYDVERGTQKLEYIKPDWREGAVEIKQWALKYYLDKERYHKSKDYENGKTVASQFKEYIEKRNYSNWAEVLKAYELQDHSGEIPENDYEALSFVSLEKKQVEIRRGIRKSHCSFIKIRYEVFRNLRKD